MPKSWKEVAASEAFNALSTEQKKAAQEQYFNEVVAPAAGEFATQARVEFFSQYPVDEGHSIPEHLLGAGENLLSMATGGVGEIAGGLAGLATAPFVGGSEAGQVVRDISGALTYEPRTDAARAQLQALGESSVVQKAGELMEAGGDLAGMTGEALASSIPFVGEDLRGVGHAMGRAVPAGVAAAAGYRTPSLAGAKLAKKADDLASSADSLTGAPTDASRANLLEKMSSKKPDLSKIAEIDTKIVQAARNLGLDEIPPGVATSNAQFRDVAQGLASMPGSAAKAQYGEFLENLANKADEIIVAGGGDLDKAALSQRFRSETTDMIESIAEQEELLHSDIASKIGRPQPVNTGQLREFANEIADEFGGADELPKDLKRIYSLAYNQDGTPAMPTYGKFDHVRREIGQALRKKSGVFKDTEEGMLRRIYGKLKSQQKAIADEYGYLDELEAADTLTIKRKTIEESMTEVLGRNMMKDVMPEMATKITGLPKGNVKKFEAFVGSIPENMRGEVVTSALNDLLRGTGASQKNMGAARFVGFMNDLKRSDTARNALYKHLTPETRKSLDSLYTLANAVYKANKEVINTGKIASFFPDNKSFLSRLLGIGKTIAVGKGGMTGGPGGAAAAGEAIDSVAQFVSGKGEAVRRANDLLTSREFQRLMSEAVRDGVTEGNRLSASARKAEELLEKSAKYRAWAARLSDSEAAKLTRAGVAAYLLMPDSDDQQENMPMQEQ